MYDFRVVSDYLGVVITLTISHPDSTQVHEGVGSNLEDALQDLTESVGGLK